MSDLLAELVVGLEFEISAHGGVSRVRGFGIQVHGWVSRVRGLELKKTEEILRFGVRDFKPEMGYRGSVSGLLRLP